MSGSAGRRASLALLLIGTLAACASTARQAGPDAPRGAPDGSDAAATDRAVERYAYTDADVRFMQGMIVHHAQALEMTGLLAGRTESRDLHLLAERIDASQETEIAMMERWLRERGEDVPVWHGQPGHGADGAGSHQHAHAGRDDHYEEHHPRMPGMLSREQMARLAAASGSEFDRLFLEYMIQHHEGALTMVADLFAADGAGQEPELFRFASDVDADQRAEIARMRRMLAERR